MFEAAIPDEAWIFSTASQRHIIFSQHYSLVYLSITAKMNDYCLFKTLHSKNPSSGSRGFACGPTERHDEANGLFSLLFHEP